MKRGLAVEAPAKVNLFLRVLQQRPDGYREVETLYQSLSLADRVEVVWDDHEPERVGLRVDGPDLGPESQNLAVRAAEAFRAATGLVGSVDIALSKHVPAGAGLGGGSSDAAAVLRSLAQLTGLADEAILEEVARALGSDVPFFLGPSPLALGRGRGEALSWLTPLPRAHLVVALPDVHVATGAAYGALAQRRIVDGREVDPHEGPRPLDLEGLSWSRVKALSENDFEAVVASEHAAVRASLTGLREAGATFALLSGSGSATFGLFTSRRRAAAAARALTARHGWRFVPVTTRTEVPRPAPV